MKKAIARLFSNLFYGIGHFISIIFHNADWTASFLYPVYNYLMGKSADINDKYNLKVWTTTDYRFKELHKSICEELSNDSNYLFKIYSLLESIIDEANPKCGNDLIVAKIIKEVFGYDITQEDYEYFAEKRERTEKLTTHIQELRDNTAKLLDTIRDEVRYEMSTTPMGINGQTQEMVTIKHLEN